MKSSILILVSLLSFALGNVLPSLAQHPFYIYRNDGGFNAFYHDDIDSIMYSNYDADSIYHADIVSQVIYAYDSVFVIPLAAIDSVSFITPETVYKPGVRVLEDSFKSFVVSVDSLTIHVSSAISDYLLPLLGDKVVTTVMDDIFPIGFAGEVIEIVPSGTVVDIVCQPVALDEVFEVYYGFTQSEEGPNKIRLLNSNNSTTDNVSRVYAPGKLTMHLLDVDGFTNSYRKNDELSFDLNELKLDISVTPVVEGHGFSIVNPFVGTYFSLTVIGSYEVEESFGLKGGITWQKDNSFLTFLPKKRLFWPILPLADVYLDLGWFLRASGELGIQQNLEQKYASITHWEYSAKNEEIIKPQNVMVPKSKSNSGQVVINGQIGAGIYVEVGVDFVHTKKADLANLHLRLEGGANLEGNLVVYNKDIQEANKSTALYEQLRDTEVGINWFYGTLFEGNFWKWGFSVPLPDFGNIKLNNQGKIISFTLAPYFYDTRARLESHTLNAECMISGPQSLVGNYNFPVNAGFWVKDSDGNDISKDTIIQDYHGGVKKEMSSALTDIPLDESLAVYPYIQWMNYDILASPVYKLGLPVKIIDFKQIDSHCEKDGFFYKGYTYSYQYDVTVTVELTNSNGVTDWGYVYEDTWGEKNHISLKDFDSPYSDSRYVYYRNEAKSAVRLYEYVKFEGSEEYEYGEPVDYEVQHTLKVITGDVYDITETTAIVSGKIEGLEYSEVEDAGICYKDIELDNWERMSAQEVVGGYFSVLVSDLQSNTTYSYYAYATIDGVYYDGEVKEFTTKTSLPIITSFDVIDLTNTSATFSIFMEGINETVEDVGIRYSESYEDEDYEWVSANMNSDGYYVVQVNGLHNNTKYIYNAYAIIDGWVNIWTDDKVFTTNYCPDNHHPHAIDLGLPSGTKWACCNVGANSPGEYGGYYAWGETEEKDHYDLYNYAYYIPTYNKFIDLGKNIAGTEVDVAHVKWGGSWRMPSMLKIQELINNCDIKWGNTNGLNGMLIIGPNGNTIFLPRSHYQSEDEMEIGEYWSSSYEVLVVYDEYLDTYRYYYDQAYALEFGSGEYTDYGDWWQGHYTYRYWGQYVRPVCY